MLLIFTPTWIDPASGREAMHPAVRAAIETQVIACPWTWVIGRENPYPVPDHRNVLQQYQQARQICLMGDREGRPYDALLTIEHDNLLPDTDAVQRLLDTPGDVVYAPYLLRHGKPCLSTWQWVGERNLGMSLSQYPEELARARAAVTWRVSGTGMGCTLFRRKALELIEFEASAANNPCPDLAFAEKALRAGLSQVGRFDVPVAHYEKGRWLYPFREEHTMKFIAAESGRIIVEEKVLTLKKGEPIDVTEAEAGVLRRMGMLGEAVAAETLAALTPDPSPKGEGNDEVVTSTLTPGPSPKGEGIAPVAAPPPSRRKKAA